MAFCLFWSCDFSSCIATTSPLGRWVMRTAESVVFTLCPPGPVERMTSILRSASWMSISTSSASGMTATVAVEVWILPCDSVSGTRCTRCVPPSNLKIEYAPCPFTPNTSSLNPPASFSLAESVSVFNPSRSA